MVTLEKDIESLALNDCGASGFTLINKDFVKIQNILLHKLKLPTVVNVIDGRGIKDRNIEHLVKILGRINDC